MPNSGETYWSLVLESNFIQSAIWEIDSLEKKAKVLTVSTAAHWEGDDLISAADSVLSASASELPDNIKEPTKTVFGVPASWVEGGQIREDFIDKIRALCTSLSLEPSGFVVLPEAIAYFIKSNEGSPLSGIVIGIGQENIEISLFKLGNLVGNVAVSRSVSISEDVIEGLVRFKQGENLPSRILIFDGKEGQLEEARQSLISVDWLSPEVKEKVNFLHIPKIEIVDPRDKVLAVCLAGASEIGEALKVDFMGAKDDDAETFVPEERNFDETEVTPEELGFTTDGTVPQSPSYHSNDPIHTGESEVHHNAPTSFGVSLPKVHLPHLSMGAMRFNPSNFKLPSFSFLSFLRLPGGANRLYFMLGGLGLLLLVGFLAWFFVPTAEVTVYVSPKKIDEVKTVVIGSDLKAKEETTTITGDKTISVTGTKTVGDRAKGEVTVYRAGGAVEVPSGTKLTGPSGLAFTTDSDVSVASGSASTPSTAKVAVTAVDIGAEYNLGSNTTFSVDGFASSLDAKNENSFSGGSSREITAVSADDREEIEKLLSQQLTGDGIDKLKESISAEDFLIETSVEATSSSKEFNHKVGDEANDLRLSMEMDVVGLVVSKKDLSSTAMDALKDKVPSGFVLRADQITAEFEKTDEKEYEVKFMANLLPEIKTDEIVKRIIGKRPVKAELILAGIPGYTRAQIRIKPPLGPLATLPHLAKNISIEIASEK